MPTAADIALAKALLALLLRLYPQCYTTVEVGSAWETRHRPPPEVFSKMRYDEALSDRVIRLRWPEHPRARVIAAVCVQ